MTNTTNDQLVLIVGESSAGKSASLQNIPDQQNWWYANFESGKRLPFKDGFKKKVFTNPLEIFPTFEALNQNDNCQGIIIDSLTFMMDMYESVYICGAANKMAAWGDFQQFFKKLMGQYVATTNKTVIFTAHTKESVDSYGNIKREVPVKGGLKDNGIEAFFNVVLATKKMRITDLEKYKSPMLTITDEERSLGFKHVFQTKVTAETVGERIRAPMGMWATNETFINNDISFVLTRLKEFYGD